MPPRWITALAALRPWPQGHLRALWHGRVIPTEGADLQATADAALAWLTRAQDATPDGGVADYALYAGWTASYPETTGYLIPTFLQQAAVSGRAELTERALRMADWLLSRQSPEGFWRGGHIDHLAGPNVFDTGQIIEGLAAAYAATGREPYLGAALRGGAWLTAVQREDGAWADYTYDGAPVAYHARISWALAHLGRVAEREDLCAAATRNLDWVCGLQEPDGWFRQAAFRSRPAAVTHTIGYVLEGLLRAGELLGRADWIDRADRAAVALAHSQGRHGRLAGSYAAGWRGDFRFACLTGNAQIAWVWRRLDELRGRAAFREAADKAFALVAPCQDRGNPNPGLCGALPGSAPVWGSYMPCYYPNWAAKFLLDAIAEGYGAPP
jgi:hypothetical protein